MQAEREQEFYRQAAAAASALAPEEFLSRVLADDELTSFTAEAIASIQSTRLKEKTRAVGNSLGSLVADQSLIEPESIWIRILSSVEPAHIRLLSLFLHGSTLKGGETSWRPGAAITVREAGERLGLKDAVLPLVKDLVRCGLILSPGVAGGGPAHSAIGTDGLNEKMTATWLGSTLFVRLKLEADDSRPTAAG